MGKQKLLVWMFVVDGLAFSLNLSLCPFCVPAVRRTPLLRGPDNRVSTHSSCERMCVCKDVRFASKFAVETDRVRKKEVCGFWLVAVAVDAVMTGPCMAEIIYNPLVGLMIMFCHTCIALHV